jgi:RHS repeat-associated protein
MKATIFICLFLLIGQTCLAQSWYRNFVRVRTPQTKIITIADLETKSADKDSVTTEIQYFDGLGRPMQTLSKEASPLGKDVVSIVKYDEFGREVKKYLPYVATTSDGTYNPNDEYMQLAYYTNTGNSALKLPQDNMPFGTIVYEASPLNRVVQQFGPGASWSPDHAVSTSYLLNGSGEVPLWIISGSTLSESGSYSAGALYKTQTTDENGNNSWEYKDKQGKVILKEVESENNMFLKTYYVYDDFDRLTYVIPPKATATTYVESSDAFNELLYGYKYDERGRMTEKHIPGAGWVYMVYNKIDQVILSQDENQRTGTSTISSNTWIFSKYDAFGRVVMTGKVLINDTRSNIQSAVDSETTLWETRDNSLTGSYCYTAGAYPQSSFPGYEPLTVNYYDTYGFDSSIPPYAQAMDNPVNSNITTGLLTGSKVKVLDNTATWLSTVTYYDEKGRPLQVFSKNILGSLDRNTSKYDFTGKVIKSERNHNSSELVITNRYEYDHAGRKTAVYQQTGSSGEVELAQYNYNELGQLVKKNLHGDNSTRLQGIDYRYNIRGWLTSINNAILNIDINNDDMDDAFGEELSYNSNFSAGGTQGSAQWNGNISGMKWKSKAPSTDYSTIDVNAYSFQYDKLNRLKLANYGSGANGSTWSNNPGKYNEAITYDVMGNILTLLRSGINNTTDNLSYDYGTMSNKLTSVTNSSTTPVGFINDYKAGTDYAYDANGNLTTDLNKGLTIDYNYLNLPKTVTNSTQTIGYTYDATGRKLKKTFDGQPDHYYIDGLEYSGSTLLFAMTEEGRIRPNNSDYTYEYFLKDHLGNVRVVLTSDNSSSSSQSMVYPAATMETMTAATETTYYSNLDKVRSFTPVGFKSIKKNENVAHLKGTDPNKQIGPSITVKVNSGDKISLTAQSFYPDNTGSQRTGLAETALSQLVNAMINPAGLNPKGKIIANDALRAQGFDKSTSYRDMMNKLPNSDYNNDNDRPKAYMVWMLFDKQMKLVKTGKSSGARQIPEGAGQVKQMAENDIVMDQGGFLTAYTVNESPASVYIDNFQLAVATGPVLEINDYYPFGMLNNGLSDPGITDPINNYKYNGKELQTELSLQWLDYGARFYDPVIGRFHTIDPLSENYSFQSPYVYAGNEPIRMMDINGMGPGGDIWNFLKGVGNGIGSGAKGTVNFINSDAWKAQTWKNTGNLLLGAAALQNGNIGTLSSIDATFGTNTVGAVECVAQTVNNAVNTLANGTPEQKGEVVGQVLWGVAEGVALSKGAGAVSEIAKGTETVATGVKVSEGGIQYSEELVQRAQNLYPKKAEITELHHIDPKYLGGDVNGSLVPLNGSYHQVITNEFRAVWPYGKGLPSPTELKNIKTQVYSKFPLPPGY